MKTFLLILLLAVYAIPSYSQNNITNTLGTGGIFTIKDASTNYFTLSQSNGLVNILKNLRLENTTGSDIGVLYKGADRFMHNSQAMGTYGYNTFLGIYAGNFTMSGTGGQSSYNTGIGYNSLKNLTTGYDNTGVGVSSLSFNTTGNDNSAFGNASLSANTIGNGNSAFGSYSLVNNTTGSGNSAFGLASLSSNTIGEMNSAFGDHSLYHNTGSNNSAFGWWSLPGNSTGCYNSAFGVGSLYYNTTGNDNSAYGVNALSINSTGYNNCAFGRNSLYGNGVNHDNSGFGHQTLQNSGGYYNSAFGSMALVNNSTGCNNTAIGYDAQVPDGTASNQVRIGNTAVTYAGVQVAWTITSDRRWKSNILNSNLGLNFISKLNPVSYTRINDENKKTEYGFIAQEVGEVLKENNIENSGMITITDEGKYELRYNDLLAPMVKAIQELNDKCEELKKENEQLKTVNEKVAKLEKLVNELTTVKSATLTEIK